MHLTLVLVLSFELTPKKKFLSEKLVFPSVANLLGTPNPQVMYNGANAPLKVVKDDSPVDEITRISITLAANFFRGFELFLQLIPKRQIIIRKCFIKKFKSLCCSKIIKPNKVYLIDSFNAHR